MRKCDFLLTYEIKNREAENICLLKYELERRGYTVIIQEQYGTFFDVPEPIDARVIVIPAFYRERARFYTSSHVIKADRIVNLQWEQMLSESRGGGKDALAAIKPWGYDAIHIAWGEDNRNRLINVYGVPENHVSLTGHIGMDFLRVPLKKYYYSRDEICKEYNIPQSKTICLFISSFAITTMHERFFEGASQSEAEKQELYERLEVSTDSKRIILEWFDQLLCKDDIILIYRPHPEESDSEILLQMEKKHHNFRVIRDRSVKQWIIISDRIMTWASTSVVEVYFAGKSCLILNPLPLPKQMKMELYKNAVTIKTWEEFIGTFYSEKIDFPIPGNDINFFYYRNNTKLSYELVCDVLEKSLASDEYVLAEPIYNSFRGIINAERIKCHLKKCISNSRICKRLHDKNLMKHTRLRKNIDDIIYVKEKLEKNHVTEKEVENITSRINYALTDGEYR